NRQGAVEGFPELPRQQLRDFALLELTPADRAALNIAWGDPASWQRLTEEYFKRKLAEHRRLRQQDLQHQQRRAGAFLDGQPLKRPGGGGPEWCRVLAFRRAAGVSRLLAP